MPTPIDPTRLPGLKSALSSFGQDEKASHKQLAELYGVSTARLSTLIKGRFPKSFPTPERHEDKTFWYPAHAAIVAMIEYLEGGSTDKFERAKRHQAVMGGATPAQQSAAALVDQKPMSATELNALASARTRIWNLEKDQQLYVRAADVRQKIRASHAIISREVMNLPTILDPNGTLDPAARLRVSNACRNMLLKMHAELGNLVEIDDGQSGSHPGGAGSHRALSRRASRRSGAAMG